MTVHQLLHNVFSAPADADLSTDQFRILYMKTDGDVDIITGSGTMPIGVLLNKPAAAARAARVAGPGCICKCEAGATVDEGQLIQAVAGGRGSPAAVGTATRYVGVAMSPAASGE